MQQAAVSCTEGPLLLLAGAGSGKTRVLTERIAYLISEIGVNPYNILAITFTNKAAGEMRERVDRIVSYGAESVWVSTFHSLCVRILRRHINQLDGYESNFTIYDSDDQKACVKACLKKFNMDPKQYSEKSMMAEISRAKERFISCSEYDRMASGNYRKMQTAKIYSEYERMLRASNALDFDDLLYKTVELFQFHPDILEQYQERFRYIMVDEYQDTNHIQFLLIKQLASKYRNLCVVGDDDQSIYKFRGANIYNILNFEEEYPEAQVIKLEQNYRSTKNILNAANGVISHNEGRKEKALWTEHPEGDKVVFSLYDTEYQEAENVVRTVMNMCESEGRSYNEFAILYRTNAQSRTFEEKLLFKNVPYKIIGGQNFYGRKEVKDLICYLKAVDNGQDNMAIRRIINVPKRGIGAASIDKIQAYADSYEMSMLDAMFEANNIPGLNRAASKVEQFTNLIMDMRDMLKKGAFISEVYDAILEQTGYWDELLAENTEEAEGRMENLTELKNKIVTYEEEAEHPNLSELLEEIALVADVDNLDQGEDKVLLMTLHSAKGLEFPVVFLGGMEDNLFPSKMSLVSEDEDAVEEERRLCYVGITRAMEKLYLSASRQRMMHGTTNFNPISRFVKEIPEELIDMNGNGSLAMRRQKEASLAAKNTLEGLSASVKNKPYSFGSGAKPAFGKEFKVERLSIDYGIGDTVRHIKFGTGVVTELVSGGKDYEVTVEFENVGVKRMFASFAKLKKIDG
ncbi:MAG: UvrD-helicase domain-containing protein [Eubacteriales bacterium]|nr:UvrD-helicase domain-containing protein [Eubacteriales bacterium]